MVPDHMTVRSKLPSSLVMILVHRFLSTLKGFGVVRLLPRSWLLLQPVAGVAGVHCFGCVVKGVGEAHAITASFPAFDRVTRVIGQLSSGFLIYTNLSGNLEVPYQIQHFAL